MNTAAIKHVLKVDVLIFSGIMLLALLGVGITDYSVSRAHSYWRYLMIVMAVLTTLWGVWRSRKLGLAHGSKLLYQQMILWGAALTAMMMIYLLQAAGRLDFEITGLMILLVLALVTFIDGMLVSWKLYLVGLILLMALLLAMYVEAFLWMIVLAALLAVALVVVFVMWKIRSHQGE
ncbi:MAG: hypothetical protein BWK73_10205 [Thiothrix lacustris]|uniref:Uncharacterized protein n=1 Tax=Thiothrix lacustris TaxID=525917 RepID=A0A1Y1QVA1_9GAMM|nr:MAG: hypothetical protein BWK73_10205 [Thiothrix lacustris]